MKKVIALILVCTSLLLQCGCMGKNQNSDAENNSEIVSVDQNAAAKNSYVSKAHIKAEYVGCYNIDAWDTVILNGHDSSSIAYYGLNEGKYGIIAISDQNGCKPKFEGCRHIAKDYYNVITNDFPGGIDPEIVNITGVADINGNIIVPEQYCSVEYLNDRFFKVITVTEFADSKEDAVLEDVPHFFLMDDSPDIPYKGKWEIYDVEKNSVVPGLSGTLIEPIHAYGNTIEYNDTYYTPDGKAHPEYAEVLANGSYIIANGNSNTLYNKNSEKLFNYQADEMTVIRSSENNPELMIASSGADNTAKEYFIDMNGKKVSAEFHSVEDVYLDKYVITKNDDKLGLSQLDGKEIVPCEYSKIGIDTDFGLELFALKNNEEIKYIDSDGTVIASTPCDNQADFYYNVTSKLFNDRGWRYFNIKTGEFDITVENSLGLNWCIESDAPEGNCIIDTLTGNKIIESSAEKSYSAAEKFGNYVLMRYSKSIDTFDFDIYKLTLEY